MAAKGQDGGQGSREREQLDRSLSHSGGVSNSVQPGFVLHEGEVSVWWGLGGELQPQTFIHSLTFIQHVFDKHVMCRVLKTTLSS